VKRGMMAATGEDFAEIQHLERLHALEDAANVQPIGASPIAHAFSLDFEGLPSIAVVVKAPDADDADTLPELDEHLFLATRAVRRLRDGYLAFICERPASGTDLHGLGAVPPNRMEGIVRRLIEMVNIISAQGSEHGDDSAMDAAAQRPERSAVGPPVWCGRAASRGGHRPPRGLCIIDYLLRTAPLCMYRSTHVHLCAVRGSAWLKCADSHVYYWSRRRFVLVPLSLTLTTTRS
jgi:hypothetical protein